VCADPHSLHSPDSTAVPVQGFVHLALHPCTIWIQSYDATSVPGVLHAHGNDGVLRMGFQLSTLKFRPPTVLFFGHAASTASLLLSSMVHLHAVASSCIQQNAECVNMFPVPLPRPGYFASSLTELQACVPPAACPGVTPTVVDAAYQQLLGSSSRDDQVDRLLEWFNSTGVSHCELH
jgi:hypothetical protein